VATAAVADWRAAAPAAQKMKKAAGTPWPALSWVETPDILATVAQLPEVLKHGRPYCVGFAAESHELLTHAREKLLRKKVPLIVANWGPATFGQDQTALVLLDAQGQRELPQAPKLTLARQLVAEIATRLAALPQAPAGLT
jgi:phosphopantothenoylcysteine decarboxylase / phosphopantothenate---cysteine ligase